MTLDEAKKVKVGDKVIARLGTLPLSVECEVTEIIEGIERIKFRLAYQREDGKMEHITRTHMRCWGIRRFFEQDKDVSNETKLPLSDRKPVGEWVYDHDLAGMRYYRCTNCTSGYETLADENEAKWWRFCPRCGSKMFTKTKEELQND